MEKRNRYASEFKPKVVMEVLREQETVNQIAAEYELNSQMVSMWKREFIEKAPWVFDRKAGKEEQLKKELAEKEARYQKIVGQLSYELDWLEKNLESSKGPKERMALCNRTEKRISAKRQAQLLGINRTGLYVKKKPSPRYGRDAKIMHRIDEIYTAHPFYGYRRITRDLNRSVRIGKGHVLRLMRAMGLSAIYPKANLSKMFQRQYIRPYLLRNLEVERPDQIWCIDITYIRMGPGFMFLFAIIGMYSRYIVDWELSATLEKEFVLSCLRQAFLKAKPQIVNSDQGCQFTNEQYIGLLKEQKVTVSMDSKGRALDNIHIERFFRSLKYEEIYLNEYTNPRALRKALARYIDFHNTERPHQSLEYETPASLYVVQERMAI